MIDYRDLLRKYIRHVGAEEGTTFLMPADCDIDSSLFFPSWIQGEDAFSREEWRELNVLDRE